MQSLSQRSVSSMSRAARRARGRARALAGAPHVVAHARASPAPARCPRCDRSASCSRAPRSRYASSTSITRCHHSPPTSGRITVASSRCHTALRSSIGTSSLADDCSGRGRRAAAPLPARRRARPRGSSCRAPRSPHGAPPLRRLGRAGHRRTMLRSSQRICDARPKAPRQHLHGRRLAGVGVPDEEQSLPVEDDPGRVQEAGLAVGQQPRAATIWSLGNMLSDASLPSPTSSAASQGCTGLHASGRVEHGDAVQRRVLRPRGAKPS